MALPDSPAIGRVLSTEPEVLLELLKAAGAAMAWSCEELLVYLTAAADGTPAPPRRAPDILQARETAMRVLTHGRELQLAAVDGLELRALLARTSTSTRQ